MPARVWVVPTDDGRAEVWGTRTHWPTGPLCPPMPRAEAWRVLYHLKKRGAFTGWITHSRKPWLEVYTAIYLETVQWGTVVEDRHVDDGTAAGAMLSALLGLSARSVKYQEREKVEAAVPAGRVVA